MPSTEDDIRPVGYNIHLRQPLTESWQGSKMLLK